MEISPLDVRNQVFRKKMKGYDPDEVKQFLDAVADRMEQMLKATEALEKDVVGLREKTEAYAKMEQTLRDTLLTAQRISTDARANAEHGAQILLKEAEVEAKRRVADATARADAIAKNRDVLRSETVALAAKVRGLVEGHLAFLKGLEEEVTRQASDNRSQKGVHVS